MGEVALKSGETKQLITCIIKTINISFTEDDQNKTFHLPEENLHALTTAEELVDFMDFIHYTAEIDLARLNKNHIIREWSYMYNTMLKVFAGWKTGLD